MLWTFHLLSTEKIAHMKTADSMILAYINMEIYVGCEICNVICQCCTRSNKILLLYCGNKGIRTWVIRLS